MAGAVGNEVDVAAEEAFTAKLGDDVASELVGDFARAVLVYRAEIALGQQLGAGDIGLLHIEQPARKHELLVLRRGVSEGQILSAGRRRGPVGQPGRTASRCVQAGRLEVRWLLGNHQRIHALACHVEQARILNIGE